MNKAMMGRGYTAMAPKRDSGVNPIEQFFTNGGPLNNPDDDPNSAHVDVIEENS